MQRTYVAHGMTLRSELELPGMTPCEGDCRSGLATSAPHLADSGDGEEGSLPSLALRRVTPSELDASWSGHDGEGGWQGRLGDGHGLTIARGRASDLMFSYGERARFHLDAAKTVLRCAPETDDLHWQRVLISRVLPDVALELGYEALHASAVESPRGVVAVAAPSGMGKTTLAVELMRRGWPLFADDVLTLSAGAKGVRAHSGAPLLNLPERPGDGVDPTHVGRTVGLLAGERWVAAGNATAGTRHVQMICLLERAEHLRLELRSLPSSPLPLAPYMLGMPGERDRERSRFSLYAELMGSAKLMRATCGREDSPAALADLLERAQA